MWKNGCLIDFFVLVSPVYFLGLVVLRLLGLGYCCLLSEVTLEVLACTFGGALRGY